MVGDIDFVRYDSVLADMKWKTSECKANGGLLFVTGCVL